MTIRDLTKRQLYNLRRRCDKEEKQWKKRRIEDWINHHKVWQAGFNAGLKAGLEQHPL